METIDQLRSLVGNFARDLGLAKKLTSPNAADDIAIRIAIVGFSYNSPTEQWDLGHYEFIRNRLDEEYDLPELECYGGNYQNI